MNGTRCELGEKFSRPKILLFLLFSVKTANRTKLVKAGQSVYVDMYKIIVALKILVIYYLAIPRNF